MATRQRDEEDDETQLDDDPKGAGKKKRWVGSPMFPAPSSADGKPKKGEWAWIDEGVEPGYIRVSKSFDGRKKVCDFHLDPFTFTIDHIRKHWGRGTYIVELVSTADAGNNRRIFQRTINIEDGASDNPTFAEKAKKLLERDKVAAIVGCYTSASRKAVLPTLNQNKGLLYYPTYYEGQEQDKQVIYPSQEATQSVIAAIEWMAKQQGKTFFLVGSDYIWPRTSNKIARKHIENVIKGEVVGEEYYPLGNTQFGSLINKIKLKKPDVVFVDVVGGSTVAFFKQLKAAGVTGKTQVVLTLSVTEDEMLGVGGENAEGFYSSMKYFQSLDNANNKKFVEAFKAKYGANAVIGDVTQAGYLGPWLWKAAVEKAGSFDIDKVVAASPGIELKTAPEGYVKLHENHHLWSKTRIGQIQKNGQFKLIYESGLIEPNPFPKGYQ